MVELRVRARAREMEREKEREREGKWAAEWWNGTTGREEQLRPQAAESLGRAE
jgi:hypothetical protein